MASWVPVANASDFSLWNLPYGVFGTEQSELPQVGVAIGDFVLDLKVLAQDGVFADLGFDVTTLEDSTLNAYAALGKKVHRQVRQRLQQLLNNETLLGDVLRDNQARRSRALVPISSVQMYMPMVIGDYTDFFVGLHHALTCAGIVKPGMTIEQACPCFYTLPVAYHGRGSSVVISGTPFHRPKGQFPAVDGSIISGPCQRLDFEIEFAAFVGKGNDMGNEISVEDAEDHIFGFVLMNDWSARDIQMYELAMMGPSNGKNFCTTISPWVVPLEALEPFRVAPQKTPRHLPEYLHQRVNKSAYSIPIQATLEAKSQRYKLAQCNTNNIIFSFAQMIAHHTHGGCPLRSGDLIGTGTLSGPSREEAGCLLEATSCGKEPYDIVALDNAEPKLHRVYLEDWDTVEFTAQGRASDGLGNVWFGVCQGKVLPAS